MEREVYNQLIKWKESDNKKPLILEGARQVGKTWILKEFGRNEYGKFVYINCDNNPDLENLFIDYDIERIIRLLSAISEVNITPSDTLIFLDEIQELDKGLASLKYFCECEEDYHIAVAGSLLGMQIHRGTGFPVGKVNRIKLGPLSFNEFLKAKGRDHLLGMIESHKWEETNPLSNTLTDILREYYYVGGMPEAVQYYIDANDLKGVRSIQRRILEDYRTDFSKHAPASEVPRINMVWDSVPKHLSKENKKFVYGAIKKGGRAKEFEKAIMWLQDAGLIHKVCRLDAIKAPTKFYEDEGAFKIFMLDLGLLGAMTDVKARDVLVNNGIFSEYKGAFTEQYVAEQYYQVKSDGLYYYSNENSTKEIDFVTEGEAIYPIEVKAEENLRSKSLSSELKNNVDLYAWRFSMSGYRKQERMTNIPLYLAAEWFRANCDEIY